MTELQFQKLRVGDQLVSKRSPGIVQTVTNRKIDVFSDGTTCTSVEVENSAGRVWVSQIRHKEFSLLLKQEKMAL